MADPHMVTDSQRVTRGAFLVDRADKSPLVDKLAAERYLFEAAGIPRISDFLPDKLPQMPPSPEQIAAQAQAQKAQTDAARAQIEQLEAQSKLGLTRAQELQFYTQAMVNFAKARAGMAQPQIDWMESQLNAIRLNIEATNTAVRAAQVDATMHGQRLGHHAAIVGHAVTHHGHNEDIKQRAREIANAAPTDSEPGPSDTGGGNGGPADVPEPDSFADVTSRLPAMAPPSSDQGGPAVPGPPAGSNGAAGP